MPKAKKKLKTAVPAAHERLLPSLDPRFAPADICNFLLRFGGKNQYGNAIYRMVLAETVGQLEGGEWHDYPENANIAERGGLDYERTEGGLILLGADSHTPERVVVEMRVVERYPNIEGWILERWLPPSSFGSREAWEKPKLKGHADIPLLGPYPEHGGYDICVVWQEEASGTLLLNQPRLTEHGMLSKSLAEIPPLTALEKAVMWCENRPDKTVLGLTPEQRIKTRMALWITNEQSRRAKRKEQNMARIKDYMKPAWGSSLESARIREALAKKAGITSHVGA